jgi:hypothetical protein
MQVSILPASRGLRWLVDGFVIFRRKPALLSFLVIGYWLSMAVVAAVPLIGRPLNFLLIPAFSVSLMNACQMIDKEKLLPPQVLFSGFHRNLQTLLILGLIHLLSTLAVLGLSALFDGGLLFRMLIMGEAPARDETSMSASAQLAALLLIPVYMAFLFAPVLSAWHDMSAGKSLFFSLVACLRNWRAFLLYTLFVSLVSAFALQLIALLLGGGVRLLQVMSIVIVLIFLSSVYASFYTSYRDIFADLKNAS